MPRQENGVTFGTFSTRRAAEQHEKAVQYFKHHSAMTIFKCDERIALASQPYG